MIRDRRGVPMLLRAGLAASLLGGCVYYNGMYNANRLANSARKAEREGRTFEANNLWGQVATKAESVVVRHPKSKYAEEAAILRGLALARMGQCEAALGPLGRVAVASVGTDLTEDALLAIGRCQVFMGNIAAADAAFAGVTDSKNSWRRREARFLRAQTLRQAGRYEEALTVLEEVREPREVPERLLSLAGAGRVPEAMALADSLVARGDTTQPWDSLLVSLGRQDPSSASSLVDRVGRLPNRPAETRARWLLDDGRRLIGTDTARARNRFQEAVKIGGPGDAAGRSSLELVRLDLRGVRHARELSSVIRSLRANAELYPSAANELIGLSNAASGVLTATASVTPGSPQGDLRLFFAAEAARDTLVAPRLAAGLFQRILREWPESPYAPKAALAAQRLNPEWADSARALLEAHYLESPYLAMIRGEEGSAYRQLEDSLSAFAAAQAKVPATAPGVRPATPGRPTPAGPDDDSPAPRSPRPPPNNPALD
ncbi:MAG: tetratricopeptide repeat protein [Gemmatimonadales bacterium]